MPSKRLVIDANVLVRAVLGRRVRSLLETYCESVAFLLPECALSEALEHLPNLILRHSGDPETALLLLHSLAALTEVLPTELYVAFEDEARARLGSRDPDDWPMLAAALAFDCPIWTEDTDFFGCGVATWTSNRVERFLSH
jgi:predicted nucleic acid-binding protein